MSLSLLDITLKGGPLMYVLYLISLVGIAIVIERYLVLRKAKRNTNYIVKDVTGFLMQNQKDRALQLCERTASPMSRILAKGIDSLDFGIEETNLVLEQAANEEVLILQKNMGMLSTFAAIGPLVGFLGTVTGMIKVFYNMQMNSANGVDIQMLSGGIWEALITTVGGLVVGIIAILFYNHLIDNTEIITKKLESQCNDFLMYVRRTRNENNGS